MKNPQFELDMKQHLLGSCDMLFVGAELDLIEIRSPARHPCLGSLSLADEGELEITSVKKRSERFTPYL